MVMKRARLALRMAAFVVVLACGGRTRMAEDGAGGGPTGVRFLALGDSYTIGEGVAEHDRWPVQLAALLRQHGVSVAEPEIVARTGWITGELSAGIDAAAPRGPYALVTLLIGVNNQYRGLGLDEYRDQLRALLHRAVAFAGGDAGRVVVVSIPDWGVTPFAEGRDRAVIHAGIDAFNDVNRGEARRAGAGYVDVTPATRRDGTDPAFIAGDGLHPSGKMYTEWARLALPAALSALSTGAR
jgi:lysophospholipase L1-like esterase